MTQEQDSYASVDITEGLFRGFSGGSMVKNPPANAGDVGLIPGLGSRRSLGYGNAGEIPWTGEPDGLQSMWSQKRHDLATKQ